MMQQPVIWYLHHYAGGPSLGMSYRPYYLCKEFNKSEYKSYIIGASFHHLLYTPIKQNQAISHQVIDEQDYIFLKTLSYKGNTPRRVFNMLSYAWQLGRRAKNIIALTHAPSVIIVSSAHPFHYFAARRIAKKYRAKLIFEVRDLWPLSLIELLNFSRFNPLVLMLNLIERFAYKHSDYVVSLLPNAFEYMKHRGLKLEQFRYISNGAATDEVSTSHPDFPTNYTQQISEKRQKGQFLIGYAGAHGIPNSLDDLIDALILLKKEHFDSIHVFLLGRGEQKEKLQQIVKQNNLESVTFLDNLPKKQVSTFLQSMDALYLGWKNKALYQYGISPNKLYDYMLSAKPILHIFTGPHCLVRDTQSGLTLDAENPVAIANGIKQMAALPKDNLVAMGERGKEAVSTHFSYKSLAEKYMNLFKPSL